MLSRGTFAGALRGLGTGGVGSLLSPVASDSLVSVALEDLEGLEDGFVGLPPVVALSKEIKGFEGFPLFLPLVNTESPLEALLLDTWRGAVDVVLLNANKRAQTNARRVADTLAEVAKVDDAAGNLAVRGWSAKPLAELAGCNVKQWEKGLRTLAGAGLTQQIGTRTHPVYMLAAPSWAREAFDYGRQDTPAPWVTLNDQQWQLAVHLGLFLHNTDMDGNRIYAQDRPYVLWGSAGSGKSRAVVQILQATYGPDHDSKVLYVTYSGKAADVLRDYGVNAKTIHSVFYTPTGEYDGDDNPEFAPKAEDDWDLIEVQGYDLVVLDEASMVDAAMGKHIANNSRRLLVIGDNLQLGPIGGESPWFGPDIQPDFRLTQVHRYSGRIGELANELRSPTWHWRDLDKYLERGRTYDINDYDIVIAATNRTRWKIIQANRKALGRHPQIPHEGDRITFTQNHRHDKRLAHWRDYRAPWDAFNGMLADILEVIEPVWINRPITFRYKHGKTDRRDSYQAWRLRIRDVGTDKVRTVLVHAQGFQGGEVHQNSIPRPVRYHQGEPVFPATFAGAMTAHRAQGSGFNRVLVVDAHEQQVTQQGYSDLDARRWLYTAVTRARQHVDVCSLKQIKGCERMAA